MPIALLPYAVITDADLAIEVPVTNSAAVVDQLKDVCNRVTGNLEAYCRRELITRAVDRVEFHTLNRACYEIDAIQYPIISVSEVNEDFTRQYAIATRLTADVDYILSKPRGRIIRMLDAKSGRRPWLRGYRAIRLTLRAGYAADRSDLPYDIRDVALQLAAMTYREATRGGQGILSQTDAAGTLTRWSVPMLTRPMKEKLAPHRRLSWGSTGEIDA